MWKSPKFILAAVLVAVMLIGGTAGVALAQGEDEGQGRRGALMARVAEILNIDQQELEDAFKQAQSELREEALDTRLHKLVDEGTLTQEQADEYKAWIEARPDIPIPDAPRRDVPRPRVGPEQLQKLVDEGILTQEELEQLEALRAKIGEGIRERLGPRNSPPIE